MRDIASFAAARMGAPRGRWPASLSATLWAGVAAALLVWAASATRPWHALELKSLDVFTTLTAAGHSDIPVVILAIDEPTFQQLQRSWPFPRSVHAQLLARLQADGAAAVGFDVLFSEPSTESEDAALERAIAAANSVVLAFARERTDGDNPALWNDIMPLRRFVQAGAVPGDSLVQPDDDFVVRRANAHATSFAARLSAMVDARVARRAAVQGPSEFIVYRGPRGTFETRSYYQAVVPGMLPPGFFRDKIVLVGRSALAAVELGHRQADLFNSPFAAMGGERLFPGVELQATLIDNQLTGARLRSVDDMWSQAFVVLAVSLLVWTRRRWRPVWTAVLALLLATGVLAATWGLFTRGLWLPPLFPVATVLAVYGSTALVAYAARRRRARLTRAMFAQYLPPAVVSRLVADPTLLRLGGEAREITLMFTDLAHFTTLSEQLTAEQTVEVLTGYFNAMTPIIHAAGGTVDKFMGDAVMAFWGAPLDDAQHAEHAVRAAIAMQQAMPALAADLARRGLPPVQMRIGLHTGRVVVGNVGSVQRFSYTAIGDAVNLAARLEGANKAFGSSILISSATASRLPADIGLRALDDVIVKGRTEPVRVFTPCADERVRTLSAQALERFRLRQWSDAEACLRAVLAVLPGDLAAARLLLRVDEARHLAQGDEWTPAVTLDKL